MGNGGQGTCNLPVVMDAAAPVPEAAPPAQDAPSGG
jgi:hypothetical protein